MRSSIVATTRNIQIKTSEGAYVEVKVPADVTDEEVSAAINDGHWFTDTFGWRINPAHIVSFREPLYDDKYDIPF